MAGVGDVRQTSGTEAWAADGNARPRKAFHVAWLLVAMLLVVPIVGFSIFKLQGAHVESEAYGNLSAIAELKAGQIESWLTERKGDGVTMMINKSFINHVADLQRTDGTVPPEVRREVTNKLTARKLAYAYDSVLLLDPQGKLVLAVGEHNDVNDQTKALLPVAFASGQVQHGELLLENGVPHIDFVVPLMREVQGRQLAAGAVVLRTDPHQFLFPFIRKWPSASQSGETLLLRRDGEDVLFLNELRHRKGTAMTLRRPISAPNLPGAVAVRETTPGTAAGVDYRDVPVLVAYRPVAGTSWRLIAKLDRDEVMAPLRVLMFWVSLVALIGIALVSVALWLLWRQQQRMQEMLFQAERAKADRLLQQFFDLPFIGMAIVSPETKRWVRYNERLCEILGYSREDLAGKTWVELTHPEDMEIGIADFNRVMRGESDGFTQNKRYVRKDGAVVFANIDVKCVRKDNGSADYMLVMIQDLTERKHAEDVLRESEARYRTMFQANPHPMWVYDMETLRFLAVNDAAVAHYGYSPESFLSMTIKDIRPQDEVPRLLEMISSSTRSPIQNSGVWRHLKQDGTIIDVEITSHRLDFGRRNARLVLAHDITERKKYEDALAASAARFRAITETATYAIITADVNGNIVEWNEGAQRTFGYTRAEALGLPLTRLMPERFRDRHSDGLGRAQAGGKVGSRTAEYFGVTKGGDEFPLELTLSEWSTAEGRFFTAIIRDITERRRTEETLRKLSLAVEQSPSSIVITDLDANIEYVNEGFEKATGYSFAEVIGQNPRVLNSGKNPRATYEGMWAHLTRGEVWKGELINRRKDGSEIIELVLISPVRQPDGTVTHYLAIKEDITQRKMAVNLLNQQLDELRRWHETTMGREMRVLELKREVNALLAQAGQPLRYSSTEASTDEWPERAR